MKYCCSCSAIDHCSRPSCYATRCTWSCRSSARRGSNSADLTDVQPAEYRADLVVLLLDGLPVLGIVVEVQLSQDDRKRFVWPVYAASLRARLKCQVSLLVVTVDETVARWAAKPIDMGNGSRFVPLVLRPSGIPEVIDEQQAQSDPELAVLSAMAHGNDAEHGQGRPDRAGR